MESGLFERWLDMERATGRTMEIILEDLNAACGTKYQYTWPHVMKARGYGLERLPTKVRRYMMSRVLPLELDSLGLKLSPEKIFALVVNLT